MRAIELETEIDENHEIHLQLPEDVRAGKAKILVLYEETTSQRKPRKFGQFRGQIEIRDDFPSEVLCTPKKSEIRQFGKYHSRHMMLTTGDKSNRGVIN